MLMAKITFHSLPSSMNLRRSSSFSVTSIDADYTKILFFLQIPGIFGGILAQLNFLWETEQRVLIADAPDFCQSFMTIRSWQTHVKTLSDKITESVKF